MEITIFAKPYTSNDGKQFHRFIGTLHQKSTGEEVRVQVKFRRSCGSPRGEDCPMNIKFDRKDINLATEPYDKTETDPDTGEITIMHRESRTLWVSRWEKGSPYVDHSMDDFTE